MHSEQRKMELKGFTWQYWEWKKALANLNFLPSAGGNGPSSGTVSDPTGKYAEKYGELADKIRMVENCCQEADPEIADALLIGVTTKGSSVEWLHTKGLLHCERDKYYLAYAKYFWLLDKIKK